MENFDKKYKEALRKATKIHRDDDEKIKHYMEVLFPELKDEDEKIRKALIKFFNRGAENGAQTNGVCDKDILDWLEKQVSIDENEVANRVLIEVSDSIMRWLDANCAEGNMCLSNMECEDIENAVRNANWQKIYGYMKKKLEKQGGQKTQAKSALEAIKEEKVDNANKVEPKFKLGDKIRIKNPSSWDKDMEVARIEKGYYICNHIGKFSSEVVPFSKESDYELIEHKSANKVELKFKVGDWITNGDYTWKIIEVKPLDYILQSQDGNIVDDTISHVDEHFHSFTIQDAKDGDVLVSLSNQPFIYNGECNTFHVGSYCGMDCIGRKFIISQEKCHWTERNGIKPATKKQREQLEKAMADAGYKWDDEKKELKKIEQPKLTEFEEAVKDMMDDYRDAIDDNDATVEEVKEHAAYLLSLIPCKPTAWSEEDERNMQNIDSVLFYDKVLPEDTRVKLRNFLKSIKQRIGG